MKTIIIFIALLSVIVQCQNSYYPFPKTCPQCPYDDFSKEYQAPSPFDFPIFRYPAHYVQDLGGFTKIADIREYWKSYFDGLVAKDSQRGQLVRLLYIGSYNVHKPHSPAMDVFINPEKYVPKEMIMATRQETFMNLMNYLREDVQVQFTLFDEPLDKKFRREDYRKALFHFKENVIYNYKFQEQYFYNNYIFLNLVQPEIEDSDGYYAFLFEDIPNSGYKMILQGIRELEQYPNQGQDIYKQSYRMFCTKDVDCLYPNNPEAYAEYENNKDYTEYILNRALRYNPLGVYPRAFMSLFISTHEQTKGEAGEMIGYINKRYLHLKTRAVPPMFRRNLQDQNLRNAVFGLHTLMHLIFTGERSRQVEYRNEFMRAQD